MKSTTAKLSILVAACALAACTTVSVTTAYDHSASFGKYKTYALASAKQGHPFSPAADAALRDTLRTELGKRGITEATNGTPDLAIVRHVFLTDTISVQQYNHMGYGHPGAWPYRYGYYGMWAGAPATYLDVSHYTEGTLILDAVDMHTKKLVFRGSGTAIVSGPESNADRIREAVKKMVAAVPK